MPEIPEIPDSEKEKRGAQAEWAAWAGREFVAKLYAMPLRTIIGVETLTTQTAGKATKTTKTAVLDCGHRGTLYLWLSVGETMRCRNCYVSGLKEAQRMIERVGG